MAKKHKLVPGECLRCLARSRGLTPGKIWDHPENADLRANRKGPDDVRPPDKVFIPEVEPGDTDAASEKKNSFKIRATYCIAVRLVYESTDDNPEDDTFTLKSDDGAYKQEKKLTDDQDKNDQYLDLHFTDALSDRKYTLTVQRSANTEPEALFDKVPYEQLAALSPTAKNVDKSD
ncbi:hypothetical protein OT109_15600 [Phycisphaeraceae bacterium D3-23]